MRGSRFTPEDAERLYNMPHWGAGYFAVNTRGELTVRDGAAAPTALATVVTRAREAGLRLPLLLRFPHILRDRVQALQGAFDGAIAAAGYAGRYTPVYPIKVNQQASVVREIIAGGTIGLEAGSKPELLAVLGLLPAGRPVICNGYKDRAYIRLALIGGALGHRVTLVVEKISELAHIFAEEDATGLESHLGVRIRLASIGAGHWQNTGGEKSKFGLSAGQIRQAVTTLQAAGRLDRLRLLHFHLGSQVANLRDIRHGLREAAQYYRELRCLGAPIDTVDVGGGLGVDYEGTRSRSYCSMNYGLEDYAGAVVEAFAEVARESDLPMPDIVSESGRALTAHHAVLVTNVIDREAAVEDTGAAPADDAPALLRELAQLLHMPGLPALERLAEGDNLLAQVHGGFALGGLSLDQRAQAEALHRQLGQQVLGELDPGLRAHREALDGLRERHADKLFCNFSLFQSLPDVWAIEQIFPIVPLSRLNERPDRRGLIRDLTCDSDGRIDHYVDQGGIETSLPVHTPRPGEDYLLGVFLVGAYQEILGDMHNLFGDTDTADVRHDGAGGWDLADVEHGDRVDELLSYVHLSPEALRAAYREKLAVSTLDEAGRDAALQALEQGLAGYTYLA